MSGRYANQPSSNQQPDIEAGQEAEHRHRGSQVRRDRGIERALRMAQVQQQRRRHEDHEAQRRQQRQVRDRLEPLDAEHLIQARHGKCARDQAR